MSVDLNQIWNNTDPKSKDDVEELFKGYLSEIRQSLGDLLAKKSDERPRSAANLVGEIQEVIRKTGTHIAKARDGASKEHRRAEAQLDSFAASLRSWCGVIATASGEAAANTRARFSDYGAWATHFSVVRMTISTFLIGISWGIVSLKWNEYAKELSRAALAVWYLAGSFLLIFTLLQAHAVRRQKAYRRLLPTLEKKQSETGLKGYWQSFRRGLRSVCGTWLPVVIYGFLTYGFCDLLEKWFEHRAATSVAWTAIVSNSSIDKEKRAATANSVDFAVLDQRLNSLATSLGKISGDLERIDTNLEKLIAPTPTPGPTQKSSESRKSRSRRARPSR